MKHYLLIAVTLLTFSISALSHEGHNHGPGQVQPTKGGVILKAEKFFLEVVGTNNDIKLYPMQNENEKSQMLKAIPLKEVKISATYKLPRAKKAEKINLSEMKDHFHAKIDAKNSHRYEVVVSIEFMGEKELLTYQIEP